ncbi:hypothetical protein DPMN_080891 [Dreissena polymorpha]|uniref:Uncharacterized protein n=1 Tax=Dreissena polymorpha TaxID=45954 RepID=A0A9D4BG18_DREPO|nr:hypothetical protein DPMN_080891 [Dreissena polymorpha]
MEDEDKPKDKFQVDPISPSPVNSHGDNLLESICSDSEANTIPTSTLPYTTGLYAFTLPYMWNTKSQLTASPYLLSGQSSDKFPGLKLEKTQPSTGLSTSLPALPNFRKRARTPLLDEKMEDCCCAKIQNLEKTIAANTNRLETLINKKHDDVLDALTKTLHYQQELFNAYINHKQEDQTLKNYLIKISETTLDMLKK